MPDATRNKQVLLYYNLYHFIRVKFKRQLISQMVKVLDKQEINVLTYCLHNLVWGRWAVQSVGELFAIPDKELSVGGDGSHRVEVDVLLNLTGHQILMGFRMSWIHESHPVAFGRIKTINIVRELIVLVHLKKKRYTAIKTDPSSLRKIPKSMLQLVWSSTYHHPSSMQV